ncbi:flavodoxin family protein [Ruminococcaceae bacterium OttesenSCG-928-A16]|nr:flavodoxin family protein [Ruminococcaceae bacterium OttesenSCG-928-A16]
MKVLLINGSPKAAGCTFTALSEVAGELQKNGIETEMFQLGSKAVHGCIACHKCEETSRCVFNDDGANACIEAMAQADGIVVGSPVYYAGPNGALCAMLDRVFYAADDLFAYKPAAAVVSCRRGGSTAALDRLQKYFTIANMPVVPSQYWNMVHGHTPEEVRQDKEGLQTMRVLGHNMAAMLKAFNKAGGVPAFEEQRIATNFIR